MNDSAVIERFLAQESFALAGVSRHSRGYGRIIYRALLDRGYRVWILHPRPEEFSEVDVVSYLFRGDRTAAPEAAGAGNAKERGLFVPPDPRMACEQSPHAMPEGMYGCVVSSLQEIPEPVGGMVLVVPPDVGERLVEEALVLGIPRFWMQPGAVSSRAVERIRQEEREVVVGSCILNYL